MKIGGMNTFSLSDYPGKVAAVVFTQGCNFQCPFCHNHSLIPHNPAPDAAGIEASEVLSFLEKRRGKLDAVVVSGGEPTLQSGLPIFLGRIKDMGFAIKLDTNGSRPEMVESLLSSALVDYIAMDLKAPRKIYSRLAGIEVPTGKIARSVEKISKSGIDHEFRTTVVDGLLEERDIEEIRKWVPSGSFHRLQKFLAENALDPALRAQSSPTPRNTALDFLNLPSDQLQ